MNQGHVSKEEIKKLLEEKRFDDLVIAASADKKILRTLISLTYDKKSLVCWRAIEAIGLVTREISKTEPEFVRNAIGRLLWMIRDESGGIGWSSPEILGEIVRNNPDKFSDVAPVIVSFLDEEKLAPGVIWAVGRIGESDSHLVRHAIPLIIPYLVSSDKILKGLAVWALGKMGASEYAGELERFKHDESTITIYDGSELKGKTIGELVNEAIAKLAK